MKHYLFDPDVNMNYFICTFLYFTNIKLNEDKVVWFIIISDESIGNWQVELKIYCCCHLNECHHLPKLFWNKMCNLIFFKRKITHSNSCSSLQNCSVTLRSIRPFILTLTFLSWVILNYTHHLYFQYSHLFNLNIWTLSYYSAKVSKVIAFHVLILFFSKNCEEWEGS